MLLIDQKLRHTFKIVLILCLISVLYSFSTVQAKMFSIKGENVNLRTGPGKKFKVKWEYGSGFPVQVLDQDGDWMKTQDFENDTGWIHRKLLSTRHYVIVKANRNKDFKINIRKQPNSESNIVGKAHYGVVFRLLKHESGWVKVRHDTGLTGWVSSHLLWGH